jgi:DNA-binding transcriptional LysR family regulator
MNPPHRRIARRTDLADLDAFVAIAHAGGFRRAATLRGVSGSALSHAMRGLEERLGVRLFHRNSRSVSLTAAGEMLLAELGPRFAGIDQALDRLGSFRSSPAGRIRITTLRDAVYLLIAPKLPAFLREYPDIDVEVVVDDRFVNMVGEGFDAGVRYGGTVPEDMVAVPLSPPLPWVVVGAPGYFATMGRPQRPEDLTHHRCIRIRAGRDAIYQWEFTVDGTNVSLDVPGHLTLGDSDLSIRMCVAGQGLFYCLRERVADELATGQLQTVLDPFVMPGPGFHAYYASHRQVPTALRLFLDHLKGCS